MVRNLLVMMAMPGLLLLPSTCGSASILARPTAGARGSHNGLKQSKINAGFIVNEVHTTRQQQQQQQQQQEQSDEDRGGAAASPSFVSLGIRSSCARKKAATINIKHSASAATRLRGGSTHLGRPPPMLGRRSYEADPPQDKLSGPVRDFHHCPDRTTGQFVAAKQNLVDDTRESWEEEEDQDNRRLNMGGGGGRAGSMPSFSRTLPPGKAPVNKKFAWVP